jgi:hypothetical protein
MITSVLNGKELPQVSEFLIDLVIFSVVIHCWLIAQLFNINEYDSATAWRVLALRVDDTGSRHVRQRCQTFEKSYSEAWDFVLKSQTLRRNVFCVTRLLQMSRKWTTYGCGTNKVSKKFELMHDFATNNMVRRVLLKIIQWLGIW